MIKYFEIKVSGQVQGVGFRYQAKKLADTLGICGSVQNLPDGTLVIEVEGPEEKLQEFLAWCQKGPDAARINKVEYHPGEVKNFKDFEIRV